MGSHISRKKEFIFEMFSYSDNKHDVSVNGSMKKNHCCIIRVENFVEASDGGHHIDIVLISRHVEDFA